MKRLLSMGILVLLFAPTLHAETRAYPVPWVAKDNTDIVFTDLPGAGSIKIFTVSGHWVKTLNPAGNTIAWDLTNDSGDKVASGIYVYLITIGDSGGYGGSGQKTTGKIVVIK